MKSLVRRRSIHAYLAGKLFLTDAANRKVMSALNSDAPLNALYVGGCVRNSLLGEVVKDIDIATKLWPRETIDCLKKHNIKYAPTGIEHGTISAIINKRVVEITTLRRDTETDGRHAKVSFTKDWHMDAARRDFTCNALYCDEAGHVFDPLGTGIEDTLARKIVFIGNAADRIKEDYLRILRFFRLYAWYGKGQIDSVGVRACSLLKDGIGELSAERVWSELKRLLSAPNPTHAIETMERIGIFQQIIVENIDLERFIALVTIENEIGKDADPILRFMALLDRNRNVENCKICDILKLSNNEKNRMRGALIKQNFKAEAATPMQIRALLYRYGRASFQDFAMLQWAVDKSLTNYCKWHKVFEIANDYVPPVFPINGDDIMRLDIPKGPKIGAILSELENWWIESDFPIDSELMSSQLQKIAEKHR